MNGIKKIFKRSANQKGLSIVEVMLAILVIGITVTSLLSLQGVLSRGIFSAHAFVDRIGYIKGFFVEVDRDKAYEEEKPQKKNIDTPKLTMTYTIGKPTGKALASYQMLEIEKIEAQYPTVFGNRTETFARFRFVVRPEKKSEARI